MIKNILIVKSTYYEDVSKELYKNALDIIGDHKKNRFLWPRTSKITQPISIISSVSIIKRPYGLTVPWGCSYL